MVRLKMALVFLGFVLLLSPMSCANTEHATKASTGVECGDAGSQDAGDQSSIYFFHDSAIIIGGKH